MSQAFHNFRLKINTLVVFSFSPAFFPGRMQPTSGLASLTLDLLGWPLDGAQTLADPTTRFLSPLTRGFLLGWGVMIWLLSSKIHDLAPEPIGQLASLVLDSAGSIGRGTASNAGFNGIVLLIAVGPLWRSARPEAT